MWRRTITFLLSLLSMVMAEATNHYFKHLGVSDGLSQVCIPSIYQDELGAVWLESYRDWETDRKSTRLHSSHITRSRMPSSA